ncbi:MAG: class I SAM-dependent methyltransferase [Nitrospirae bacterium]|nr:class I SAM-dependent methyltransferase [Nitrospirota bacterium]
MFLSDAVKPLFADGELLYPHRLDNCPVCGSNSSKQLFVLRGFAHCRCRNCGFIFVNPRLNEEGARIYYNSEYYRHYCQNNERPVNERFGPYCRTLGFQLSDFATYLRSICSKGRIVDIGCGLGGLLASMPSKDFERVGVEYNEIAAQFARDHYGLRIVSDLDDLASEQGTFDLVTAVEVIEHVSDPLAWMQDLVQLLRPSGHLVITTPNINSLDYYMYGKRCGHFCAPSHVNFFGLKTLSLLAARAGLQRTDYWYRGGVINIRHWWRTRNQEVDFWSPEVPTQNGGNVVYRRGKEDHVELPPIRSFDADVARDDRGQTLRRFLRQVYTKGMNALFAQNQMVAVFRKKT